MKNNFKKAFSLFEVSIAILIVGMLIAAISKGVDMVYDMRLATARSLTDKAPINAIDNLELWLETTSKESLATGTTSFVNVENPADKQAIGRWNDLNPTTLNSPQPYIDQLISSYKLNPNYKNPASQPTSTSQPLYIKDGINGLPALFFDGIDDYISPISNISIINNFTVFIVAFPIDSITVNAESNTSPTGTSGQKYIIYPLNGDLAVNRSVFNYCESCISGVGISLGKNGVASYEHSANYMPPYISKSLSVIKPIQLTLKYKNKLPNLYINSVNSYTSTWASSKDVFPSLSFGGGLWGYFKGYIGEIIVYSKDLSDSDRKLIEAYLIEKWRIKP